MASIDFCYSWHQSWRTSSQRRQLSIHSSSCWAPHTLLVWSRWVDSNARSRLWGASGLVNDPSQKVVSGSWQSFEQSGAWFEPRFSISYSIERDTLGGTGNPNILCNGSERWDCFSFLRQISFLFWGSLKIWTTKTNFKYKYIRALPGFKADFQERHIKCWWVAFLHTEIWKIL